MMRGLILGAVIAAVPVASAAAAEEAAPIAAKFGARDYVIDVSLSPDGKRVAFVVPTPGRGSAVMVANVDGSHSGVVARASGAPLKLTSCDWSAADRLVCSEYGIAMAYLHIAPFSRTVSFDADGGNLRQLGRDSNVRSLRISQFDGSVIDWLSGSDGTVLMARDYVPEQSIGTRLGNTADGLGVDRIDTRSGDARQVEHVSQDASQYISDGQGHVRIMEVPQHSGLAGMLTGGTTFLYRTVGNRTWQPFSHVTFEGKEMYPLAVDGTRDVAYAIKPLDGRDALYRVALDGTLKADLVYANPQVDVAGIETIGRAGRVIGATYVTDRREVEYFDPEYRALAAALGKALPKLPLIRFMAASADEKQLIVFASSDDDPGHYYWYDRPTRHLNELTPARPELEGTTLAHVRSVAYKTADGTAVPAYLTLPPGSDGRNLPAIVLPHGGPAARDEWGFDWLAQYFAHRGFAVLQPNFRGSSGYGDAWYADNGFKSWRTAVSDIVDGARWLEAQGIADPARMAILGWSYGGYAALQTNVVDPGLFKAVVAIAPVTDLSEMKVEAENYLNARIVARTIGDGPHILEGSPARHAGVFQAPVLLFHGTEDVNVDSAESRGMDAALHRAGKQSRLVTYSGLDHQLDDSAARADMLTQADAFLRTTLKLP